MRRGVSVRAYGGADKETGGDMLGEGTGVFSKKAGRKKRIEGEFRKKVHKFLFDLSLFSKIETFFPQNLRLFETKFLLLRLIKHNFPFIPPHCGVYIAQSRGTFPYHPAQTLFDLLNRRDFALSRSIRTGQKALSFNMGMAFARQRRYPFGLYRKKEGQGTGFCSIRKGAFAFLQQRDFYVSHSFLVLPPMQRILVRMERFLLYFETIGASLHRSWSDLKQSSPRAYERRDSWGVVSYPNFEKGAIRNRRVRAHAPPRHRVRPRPCHLPWRSGVRHRRRP